jgi:hypothetical protein
VISLGLASSEKSQGSGDRVPRVNCSPFFYRLVSSVPLIRGFPFFRRIHVSALNFCKSLFRLGVSQSLFSLSGLVA